MKKLLILFALVSLMVFASSLSALGANQLYFDYIVSGEVDDYDLDGFVLGGGYDLTDTFKVGIDYISGDIESTDLNLMFLKVGYAFNKNAAVTLSVLDGEIESMVDYSATTLGAEVNCEISDQVTFEGTLAFSLTGEADFLSTVEKDLDVTLFKLKLTYALSDNVGATFTYSDYSFETDFGETDANYLALGITYNF